MNLETRLAALEAEVRDLKRRLGLEPDPIPARPNPIPAQPPALPISVPVPIPAPPPVIAAPASREAAFGSYWVTRVGAVLVLLAAIFLAAYLSIYSNPVIRIGELLGATGLALAIAYWQQLRGNLRFALVLHSLGDALLFFTAFAAYAFDATKVIDGISVAIALQTAAGALVCIHALHRRSEGSAVFSLVLLGWVAGFSLSFQHSGTTLSFIAAIALIGAVLRHLFGWNKPLAFAAVACPILADWFALKIAMADSRLALTLVMTALPLVVALPYYLARTRLTASDRLVCLTGLGVELWAALFVRYNQESGAFMHQLGWDAGAFLLVAAGLASRSRDTDPIRQELAGQSGFVAAVAAALYLFLRFEVEPPVTLAILGIGIATACALRNQKRAVPGQAYVTFCAIYLLWELHRPISHRHPAYFDFGAAHYWTAIGSISLCAVLLELALGTKPRPTGFVTAGVVAIIILGWFASFIAEPSASVLTLLGLGTLAICLSSRFAAVGAWAVAALAIAHSAIVIHAGDSQGTLWLTTLFLVVGVDLAILALAPPLRQPAVHPLPLAVSLLALATLFDGFAQAEIGWSATFVWVPLASGLFLLGFLRSNPSYRIAALIAFGFCLVRLFANDLNSAFTRIVAFFLLGIILLGIGYLYSRLHKRGRAPEAPPTI